jgi:hypothetical protein
MPLISRNLRVKRHSSGADVILALTFSMLFVTMSLVCFSMFFWKATAGAGEFGEVWLFGAILAFLFAKLIDAFAELLKTRPYQADELRTGGLCEFSARSRVSGFFRKIY